MDKKTTETLSIALKTYRTQVGLSQRELASRCQVAHSAIGEIESGKANPTLDVLEKIAKELSIPISALLGGDDVVLRVSTAAMEAAKALAPTLLPSMFLGACLGALAGEKRSLWMATALSKQIEGKG